MNAVKKTKEKCTSIWLSAEEHVMVKNLARHWGTTPSDVLRTTLPELLTMLQRHPDVLPLPLLPRQIGNNQRTSVRMAPVDIEVQKVIMVHYGLKNRTSMMRHGLRLLHRELINGLPRPRPLPFPRGGVTSRLIETVKEVPANLDMRLRSHAMLTKDGEDMKFSFAGLILESSRVIMNVEDSVAVGVMSFAERLSFDVECYDEDDPEDSPLALAQLQLPPHPAWIKNELAIARAHAPRHRQITALDVMIPATAREIWAAEHGEHAAKRLPLYPEDWGTPRDRITAESVLEYLLNVQKGRYDLSVAPGASRRRVG